MKRFLGKRHVLCLSTKYGKETPNSNFFWNILTSYYELLNIEDYFPTPVRVRVKKNVASLGFVEHWKKRRSVVVQDETTCLELSSTQREPMGEWNISEYEEGYYREQNVSLEQRSNYKKQSFERDISLLAVRWFQRRRGTELKRQFYRHRHTIYASCFQDSQEKAWLERLHIPASVFERLSLEERKDWFCSEVCRRLYTKRYSVILATPHSHILSRRMRLEVAKLGSIIHLPDKPCSISKGGLELASDMFRKERGVHDIIVLDDNCFSDIYSVLELAIRSIADYGILCVHLHLPKLVQEQLQSVPFAAELQLRRFLDQLIKSAFVYNTYVEPVFSCVLQNTRAHIWLRVHKDLYGPLGWTRRSGLLYYCPHCYSYRTQPLEWTPAERQDCYGRTKWSELCEYCGLSPWHFVGTVYLGSLCQVRESSRILHELIVPVSRNLNGHKATLTLANAADMEVLFSTIAAESRCSPFFLSIEKMNELFQVDSPGNASLFAALTSRGYQVFPSHTSLDGMKTNAPLDVVWDVWKSWKLYCHPNSNHHLLSYKPLLYFQSKEWDRWLYTSMKDIPQTLAISKDEQFFHRLHNPNQRLQTQIRMKNIR